MKHLIAFAVVALCSFSCDDPPSEAECSSSADCAAGVCNGGQCVDCAATSDCADDQFCCQGTCRAAAEVDARCGCSPDVNGSAGTACGGSISTALCLAGDVVADANSVDEGVCGCGCTPADGGPLCTAPAAGGEPVCGCAENADCKGASADAQGRPHNSADTCTPQSSCVCFSAGATVCDPDSATPDCTTAAGCASLSSVDNCGSSGRVCTDEATGVAGTGVCTFSGCTCNNATDCNTGVNVNACAFPDDGGDSRCVCDGYTRLGAEVGCPLELECVEGGCNLDGIIHATEESLLSALGLPPPVTQ